MADGGGVGAPGGGGVYRDPNTGQWKMPNQPGTTTPSGQPYSEPVTGAQQQFPTAGVSPEQMYGTAAAEQMQAQASQQAMSQNAQKAQLAAEAQARTVGLLPQVMSSIGGAGGAGGGTGPVAYGQGGGSLDPSAAMAAQFARAKDTSGQIAKSALTGLNDAMASRGMMGSGVQGEEAAKILLGQAGGLADLNREQAIQGLQQAQHIADTTYQGGIQQRGQNINLAGSLLGLLKSGAAY